MPLADSHHRRTLMHVKNRTKCDANYLMIELKRYLKMDLGPLSNGVRDMDHPLHQRQKPMARGWLLSGDERHVGGAKSGLIIRGESFGMFLQVRHFLCNFPMATADHFQHNTAVAAGFSNSAKFWTLEVSEDDSESSYRGSGIFDRRFGSNWSRWVVGFWRPARQFWKAETVLYTSMEPLFE